MEIRDNPNYYFQENYKTKYICLDCRKCFKRKILSDVSSKKNIEEKEHKCPDCGNPTKWIGPKFRPPKIDNIGAWASLKTLHNLGLFNFIGFANIPVDIPETKKSLNKLLKEIRRI